MTRKRRRKHRRIRNNRLFVLLAVLLVAAVSFLAAPWKVSDPAEETTDQEGSRREEQGNASETDKEKALEFPYSLDGGKLEVMSLFQYTGMNPDCNDKSGKDIASLEIINQSEKHLANARFTVGLADGTEIAFIVTDVPAGQTVWVYAADNSSYDTSAACTSITCEAAFEDSTSLMGDKLTIDVQETTVTLTNISEEELTNLNVSCHCLFEEAYFGGLTYIYPVELIPAGESVTLQAEECYLGEAAVVRVSRGD